PSGLTSVELVPLAGLAFANISKGLDCQTALRGSIGPQRISGAVSNHQQRRRPESPQNQIYVIPQNQAQAMSANTEPKNATNVINGRMNGRFAPGYSGNPGGSPEAARKALNKDTILEMHRAFKLGGRKAIEKVMRNQPAAFLKLLVLLVPREMKMEHSGGVKAMTDEQIEGAIAAI